MPLYEYQCSKCGRKFEVLQKFADAPLTVDEECGGAVERLVSAPGLQFKGSGWYVTDYAGTGNGKSQSAKDTHKDGAKDGSRESKESKKDGSAAKDAPAKSESKASSTTPAASSDKKV